MVVRYVLSVICLVAASIVLGLGSAVICDETPLCPVVDSSTPPLDDAPESISPGGAIPFDDDDFTGFESGECAVSSTTDERSRAREVVASPFAAACGLSPAPGFAELHERPPRRARS